MSNKILDDMRCDEEAALFYSHGAALLRMGKAIFPSLQHEVTR